MDVEALRNRIQATLDPNTDTRRQAELDLKYVSEGCILPGSLVTDSTLTRLRISQAFQMHSWTYFKPSRTTAFDYLVIRCACWSRKK